MMTYNTINVYYPRLLGEIMRNCVICKNEFINIGREVCCSIKCKILDGIVKQENGCWLYRNSCSGAYGKIRWKMKWYSAHKYSYISFIGEVPEGKWVCHKCDIPKCVNPEHLFLGSPSDNRRDAVTKKRIALGKDNHFGRFTFDQIEQIRLLKSEGFTYERLSLIFNCSVVHLFNVVKNKIRKEK